ncbi:MAG: RidA family protein [Alphaproteobacteria bacterium]|nr:RidA family protein [Alphaproteobacteria bacterium]MBV8409596.1 RidA family protein [Alphaproteobacteria bacterium]
MAAKFHNPKSVSLAGKYSLGAEVPEGARLFYVSGQVGVDGKGKLQAGIEKQVDQAWKNIAQVLKSGGMTYADIVKVNVFLTDSRFIAAYRAARDRFFPKAPYPASTLLIVAGLADPGMLVEVEVVAAK